MPAKQADHILTDLYRAQLVAELIGKAMFDARSEDKEPCGLLGPSTIAALGRTLGNSLDCIWEQMNEVYQNREDDKVSAIRAA